MNFVQFEFIVFFAIVFAVYWLLPSRRLQNGLLAIASAVFYGWVHPWFLYLLYSSAVVDYFCGIYMRRTPAYKKQLLALSVLFNLGMLGVFKYLDWGIDNFVALFDALGLQTSAHTLGIFLPVGISFYTFQTMSYTIDIYRGKLEPRTDFLDYVVFISFFPQLVAGPVERASNLLPQMEKERRFSLEQTFSGLGLALFGLFKKVAVADVVAPYVDKIFTLTEPSSALMWVGAVGFSIQLIADFSGYTDLARGTARMLGFELMQNFDHPYIATSPADFFRRWHISLSTWIRDYLFFSLGGSRGSYWFTTRNLLIAMTLCGFWHGAAWNFVIWGFYFGVLSVIYRDLGPYVPDVIKRNRAMHFVAMGAMYVQILSLMLIFRAPSTEAMIHYFTLNPMQGTPDQWRAAVVLLVFFCGIVSPLWIAMALERWVRPRIANSPWRLPIRTTLWTVHVLAALSFVRVTSEDFIYFAF